MKAIIIGAGRGSRLRHLTNEIPKTLVPVLGRPMLDGILEALEFGDEADTTTSSGTFAFDVDSSGSVDFLAISEFIRSKYGVTAPVSDHLVSGDKGTLSYRNPGYSADVSFSVSKGTYDLTVDVELVGPHEDLAVAQRIALFLPLVTAIAEAQRDAGVSQGRFMATFTMAAIGMAVIRPCGTITQVNLAFANLVAMGVSARNIVLVGDQQQLGQWRQRGQQPDRKSVV